MKNEYPYTRVDPGKLPDPPEEFTVLEASFFWKIAAWCKVRTALMVDVETVEAASRLLALHQTQEGSDSDQALANANLKLAEAGFSEVDLQHLDIPVHELFTEYRNKQKLINKRKLPKPEN